MKRWLGLALVAALAISGCSSKAVKPPVTEEKAPEQKTPGQKAPEQKTLEPTMSTSCAAATSDAITKPGIVSVFFTCSADTMSLTPRAVERQVPENGGELKFALEELLKGPTAQERTDGFTSFFSDATAGMLKSVKVSDAGRAVVDLADFSARVNNASTSAGSKQLTGELNKTVFQFKNIKEVEYRFDGNCNSFWSWLQSDCHVVTAAEGNQ